MSIIFIFFFKVYFIDYAFTVVPIFSPLYPPTLLHPPHHLASPHQQFMSMGYIYKFFGSPFPILFLTFPCLFCAYLFCFLFPVPFPLILPLPSPLITFHVISIFVILCWEPPCLVSEAVTPHD